MSMKHRIPERASAFVNMKTVLTRVEKRGQLEALIKILGEAKAAEEAELGQELAGEGGEIESYSRIFKENLKVLLGIVVDEVWTENNDDVSTDKSPQDNEPTHNAPKLATHVPNTKVALELAHNRAENVRSQSKESDHSRPYSLGPDEQCMRIVFSLNRCRR